MGTDSIRGWEAINKGAPVSKPTADELRAAWQPYVPAEVNDDYWNRHPLAALRAALDLLAEAQAEIVALKRSRTISDEHLRVDTERRARKLANRLNDPNGMSWRTLESAARDARDFLRSLAEAQAENAELLERCRVLAASQLRHESVAALEAEIDAEHLAIRLQQEDCTCAPPWSIGVRFDIANCRVCLTREIAAALSIPPIDPHELVAATYPRKPGNAELVERLENILRCHPPEAIGRVSVQISLLRGCLVALRAQ